MSSKARNLDDTRDLTPRLFRIALHNRCIDLSSAAARSVSWPKPSPYSRTSTFPPTPSIPFLPSPSSTSSPHLAPRERACVLLKDALEYSLEEIACSSAPPCRSRQSCSQSRAIEARSPPSATVCTARPQTPESSHLLHLYVERCFNQRDRDGTRELATADARIHVADRYTGPLATAPYFARYERLATPW